ncbi:Uncharacterized protein HZ326_11955 [Fusarium oxysporum f. sp. albedinis]|nr:Uncharacterized protein HZ326_11955 [Fusarium oxysporum f. sp. albedinis]
MMRHKGWKILMPSNTKAQNMSSQELKPSKIKRQWMNDKQERLFSHFKIKNTNINFSRDQLTMSGSGTSFWCITYCGVAQFYQGEMTETEGFKEKTASEMSHCPLKVLLLLQGGSAFKFTRAGR